MAIVYALPSPARPMTHREGRPPQPALLDDEVRAIRDLLRDLLELTEDKIRYVDHKHYAVLAVIEGRLRQLLPIAVGDNRLNCAAWPMFHTALSALDRLEEGEGHNEWRWFAVIASLREFIEHDLGVVDRQACDLHDCDDGGQAA